jgi:regulator of protease activity HflC (stomatin/prohibitin superfamily)
MNDRLKHIVKRLKINGAFFLLVSLFVLIICWDRIVIITAPGHGGVVWHLMFGGTRTNDKSMGEGVHLVFPWNRVYDYNLRLQNFRATYNVVTADGLQVKIGVGFRWRVNSDRLGTLHQHFGPKYLETLLVPAIGSIAHEVVSRYKAVDLVSAKRNAIQREIYAEAIDHRIKNGIGGTADGSETNVIFLQDILIYDVDLPAAVRQAIEEKLNQAQMVEGYRYRVQREMLESERKAVEARGIRTFQEIVASNMSNQYLRWRGIEATLELSRSPNSKVVVIGNQQSGGLPLILDSSDQGSGTKAQKAPVGKPVVAKAANPGKPSQQSKPKVAPAP